MVEVCPECRWNHLTRSYPPAQQHARRRTPSADQALNELNRRVGRGRPQRRLGKGQYQGVTERTRT